MTKTEAEKILIPKGEQPEPKDAVHRLPDRVVEIDSNAQSEKDWLNQGVKLSTLRYSSVEKNHTLLKLMRRKSNAM
jgi:hypothetical protein